MDGATLIGDTCTEQYSHKHCHIVTRGGAGGEYVYSGFQHPEKNYDYDDLTLNSRLLKKGITNCATGIISGRTNIKNHILSFMPGKTVCNMTTGSGSQSKYTFVAEQNSKGLFLLAETKKANGHCFDYRYHTIKNAAISAVSLKNRQEQEIHRFNFSFISDEEFKKGLKKGSEIHQYAQSEDGRKVHYTFKVYSGWKGHHRQVYRDRMRLIKIDRPHAPKIEYDYEEHTQNYLERIIRKRLPDERYLEIEYYKTKDKINKNKVKCLRVPGHHNEKIDLYQFEYKKLGEGLEQTNVYDADHHLTQYNYYLKTKRLFSMTHFINNQIYSTERFFWGAEGSADEGNLKARTLKDSAAIRYCRYYKYDKRGNITKDRLIGNLRGIHENPVTFKNGKPSTEGTDFFLTTCKYSEDGLNLLIEKEEHGLTTKYEYHEGTDLLKSKSIFDEGGIQIREFFDYDDNAALKFHRIDDGSEAEQKITKITNNSIGLPRIIEEFAGDQLIGKKENHINAFGQTYQQDVYDSQNKLVYSLAWEYDRFGNVIMEKNAIGEVTRRQYDANSNLEYEWGPNPAYYKRFATDRMNRLTFEEEIFTDGRRFTTTYGYNKKGNKTSVKDRFGHETSYEYDELNRLIRVIQPPVVDENNIIYNPCTSYEYDIFGNITSITDPKGQKTQVKSTINGKPYLKQYPDGTTEKFEYSVRGELKLAVGKDHSYITYEHDFASRPTRIQYYNTHGHLLKTIVKKYNAFHLIEEIEDGQTTKYFYDAAGRLIQLEKNNQLTTYIYDTLGRESERREHLDNGYISTLTRYDLLNRVLEKIVQDSNGEILSRIAYQYDVDGNRVSIKTENQAGLNETTFQYDAYGRLMLKGDSLGNETQIFYDDAYLNDYGVTVSYSEETDPLNNKTAVIQDALGRIVLVKKTDSSGKTIQQSEFQYDRAGNQARHVERVITPNEPDRLNLHVHIYDTMNRVKQIVESVATPVEKIINYEYDLNGYLKKTTPPNGISISYDYDCLGLLRKRQSSESIDENYEYDEHHRLRKVSDLHGETIFSYDCNHNLIEEQLSNGLLLKYDYDRLGRLVKIIYPDSSSVAYVYKGYNIEQVIRFDPFEKEVYNQRYTYDLSGNVIKVELPGSCGVIGYTYNALNQLTSLSAPSWEEKMITYDQAGNLQFRTIRDACGSVACYYNYDDLYQIQEENGIAHHQYIHDSLYNAVCKDHALQKFNEVNQLLYDGDIHYEYDSNGNLKSDQKNHYTYDALNRLIAVQTPEERIEYTYDALNRRMAKKTAAGEIRYLYIGQNEVGSVDAQGKLLELRLLGQGKGAEIGAAIALELHGQVFVPLHDHQGNCCAILELATGQTIESYRTSIFGIEQLFDGEGYTLAESINPWRFSSKRHDPETGFVYFGERYYSPKTARWITPDPIGFDDGMNLYAYVHNNPFKYIDYDGQFSLPSFSTFKPFLQETFQSARFQGSLQAIGGLAEASLGAAAAMASAPTGIGAIGGFLILAHGLDNFQAGLSQAMSGESRTAATVQLLQKAGLSQSQAHLTNDVLGIAGSMGAVAICKAASTAAPGVLRSLPSESFVVEEVMKFGEKNTSYTILQLEEKISQWLGHGTKLIKNKAGDPVFLSKDASRRIRFDFIRPNPHNNPHMHIEKLINGEWKGSRVYPIDVPHN